MHCLMKSVISKFKELIYSDKKCTLLRDMSRRMCGEGGSKVACMSMGNKGIMSSKANTDFKSPLIRITFEYGFSSRFGERK